MRKPHQNHKQGAALVIVLSILAILVTLVLAFFSMVQTESQSSTSFAESVEVRNLTDVPVNLVVSQLRKATENLAPVGSETAFKTWSSQPGMIRVYGVEPDISNFRGKAVGLYKLYSDDKLVVTKSGATATASGMNPAETAAALREDTDDLATWNSKPGMFTDLNEPVPVPGATPSFKFPILDPRAATPGPSGYAIDGFNYYASGGSGAPTGTATVVGTVKATSRTDLAARVPMPVRWMYVLKDGSLVTPTSSDTTKATFTAGSGAGGTPSPTKDNPIVGRVAYWTDDDSNKININTASEGSVWQIPVSTNQTDKDYAARVPAQNEFSRYPGHPAATSLSTVFQAFGSDFYVDPSFTPNTAVFARLHKLSPRTPWGGTLAGTTTPGSATTGLPAKQERLYASVEEMFFDPARQQNLTGLDASSLELGKFFLTAHSRAPELNLFGKPRISLWPQSKDTAQRNPKDKLLAFMSETTGTTDRQWYWVREKNYTTSDPGSSQDPKADYPGTMRNDAMFHSYYRALTGGVGGATGLEAQPPPGFGVKSLKQKYGERERDQIGAGAFDLLRWGINSYSSVSAGGWPSYTYLPDRVSGNKGQSSAVPLDIRESNTVVARGYGRWPTVTEAALVFMRIKGTGTNAKDRIQPYVILETFVPTSGPASMTANIIYRIQGMDGFKAKMGSGADQTLGFAPTMDNLCNVTEGTFGELACGNAPFTGMGNLLAAGGTTAKIPTPGASGGGVGVYPFVGQSFEIPDGATDFTFTGAAFTIKTYPGWTGAVDDNKLVQTINMTFPTTPVKFKLPRLNATYPSLDSRFNKAGGRYEPRLICDGDIVRSVEADVNAAPKGDLRLYSGMKVVPASWFNVHRDYADFNTERRQFLRTDLTASNGQFGPNAGALPAAENWGEQSGRQSNHNTAGTLVKGFVYARGCPPAVPRGLDGAFLTTTASNQAPGDWDNGVGIIADGPYIRKPDEGNASGSPYMSRHHFDKETGVTYSPSRQIASAVSFGSLPTGMNVSAPAGVKPWQTLLFCPNPASRSSAPSAEPSASDHPGFGAPRDHLLLDLFWMPITEPYAISEPLSTAGKINMNYQMAPFTHIERTTGIRAVLKSTRLTAISPSSAGGKGTGVTTTSSGSGAYNKSGSAVYKQTDAGTTHSNELRYAVNPTATLQGFRNRFNTGDIFHSASEICEIFLVPQRLNGKTYASDAPVPPTDYNDMTKWWNGNLGDVDAMELTGDNSREEPYNHLYPRLTTKSNTFTVHYRVQTLRKARSTEPTEWVEGRDTVASEYRGSTIMERYLDPNESQVATAMIGAGSFKYSWDTFYRIRIIQRKQFTP